jgi:hypothetical protein
MSPKNENDQTLVFEGFYGSWQCFQMLTSQFFQSTSEKAETLDLEVLNDALSFAIKKYRGQIF